MNGFDFSFCGEHLTALGEAALWWPAQDLLCVSDLHLGKSERHARRGGAALPPYETTDTLLRLQTLLARTEVRSVICLGDSFDDDLAASTLTPRDASLLNALLQQHQWTWILGNHDPVPTKFSGACTKELKLGPLTFRHIALEGTAGEISGHYHPKAGPRGRQRPAFLVDSNRVIMPAFGTYTGGLRGTDPVFATLMQANCLAVLTGPKPLPMPLFNNKNATRARR